MLTIILPAVKGWDEVSEEFIVLEKEQKLVLEHSLVSLSKWESKWHKPFLTKDVKTIEETIDYIKCMTITQNVKPETYNRIRNEHVDQVNRYIKDPMTATWFSKDDDGNHSNRIITSEVIYSWMISLGIPASFEKWHLNRLLTLIRVCNESNTPKKKRSYNEMLKERRELNAARKNKWNTKG